MEEMSDRLPAPDEKSVPPTLGTFPLPLAYILLSHSREDTYDFARAGAGYPVGVVRVFRSFSAAGAAQQQRGQRDAVRDYRAARGAAFTQFQCGRRH